MPNANLELIERFFAAFASPELRALRDVLDENASWTFPGHHPLSGAHRGIDAIVAFFDAVTIGMGRSLMQARRGRDGSRHCGRGGSGSGWHGS
jgi:hypothetical protein